MSTAPSRRDAAAAETRRLIVDAALDLFTTRGYGATAVTDIAEAAGVAVPTIYASVGRKPEVLRAALDRLDEVAEVPALAADLGISTDPRRVVEIEARITRLLAERCGTVISALASAAMVEPEMAQIYQGGLARHRAGAEATVRRLADLGALKPGLDQPDAVAVTATLTGHRTWESLVREYGWSFDQAEAWLIRTLTHELLRIDHPSA